MHTVFFSLKRANQRVLAFERNLLEPFGITPARYGMLFVVLEAGGPAGGTRRIRQSDLRRALGVTSATVCRMVQALERRGLVHRRREQVDDRRQIGVTLTPRAFRLLRGVHRRIIRRGLVWIVLYATLDGRVGGLKDRLDLLRRCLGDRARFYFRWCHRSLYPERRWGAPSLSAALAAARTGGSFAAGTLAQSHAPIEAKRLEQERAVHQEEHERRDGGR